jgi:hypothetical protein
LKEKEIPMENYANQLRNQSKYLESLIQQVDRHIRACTVPEHQKICVTNHKKSFQYYDVDKDGKRTYLKKENMAMVAAVAQRDYDRAVMKTLLDTRYLIERFLRKYDVDAIENVYNKLCDARKVLVTPIIKPDEEFIQSWKQTHIGGKNEYPASVTFLTEQGENVRSKSEKILADLFLKYGIPYTYEPQLCLENGKCFYPDFALLNVRTRKTIYWEHFGLISDGEYAKKTLQKLSLYEESGLVVGEDLLFSMESEVMPLNITLLEQKIHQSLL